MFELEFSPNSHHCSPGIKVSLQQSHLNACFKKHKEKQQKDAINHILFNI